MPHPSIFSSVSILAIALWAAPALAGSLLGGHSVHTGEGPMLAGSGHVISQARQLGGFDAVQTGSAIEVDVAVGPRAGVTVEFDDNLQQQISTGLRGKTLVIDSRGSWTSGEDPHVHVTLPALSALAVQGSGGATIRGLKGGDLALRLAGSGDIEASGSVDNLSALLNGSGDMRLARLQAGSAKVRLNGSGDVRLNASRTLEAGVYGTGDVRYSGGATVSSHVYGTGSVEKE